VPIVVEIVCGNNVEDYVAITFAIVCGNTMWKLYVPIAVEIILCGNSMRK
jgi:hypothetical protein